MTYPPAPWILNGYALQTLHLIDVKRVRALLPREFRVFSVLPGKTLGAVFVGSYGPGSSLSYNELIVASALGRCSGEWGFWISHIYVDDRTSVVGGREIWGLPKELAQFEWKQGSGGQVVVRQGQRTLCCLNWGRRLWLWHQRLRVPSLSARGLDVLRFTGRVQGRLGLSRGRLEVPQESPFARLGLGPGRIALHFGGMQLVSEAPRSCASRKWRRMGWV